MRSWTFERVVRKAARQTSCTRCGPGGPKEGTPAREGRYRVEGHRGRRGKLRRTSYVPCKEDAYEGRFIVWEDVCWPK